MLVGYLVLTTVLGALLSGKQATIREFFLGGRKLPWPAVAGSIIATEISAVTFVAVPAIVFAPGGDLTYLQLTIGAVLARVIIGVWFVPAFYEREIYSPYDYVGNRLGRPARTATTLLFMLGAVLGQSVRVLLTALILQVITGISLSASIWIIGGIAIGWTLLGGITTVIWTDVVQFGVFVIGIVAALFFIVADLPGGWGALFAAAGDAGKLRCWNFSPDPDEAFTLWAALIANTLLCLNAYGTDQMVAQRMFCCRGPREARRAILWSSVGVVMAYLAALVGAGLYAFYQRNPLTGAAAASIEQSVDRIFPLFIVQEMPAGLTGLLIAGIFAAAISSLDSVLAALSQTVVSGFYRPWRERRDAPARRPFPMKGVTHDRAAVPVTNAPDADRHDVLVSKVLVVAWGVALCGMAHVAELARQHYGDILNLALAMASYTGGALLAAFLLAFFRLRVDYRGFLWSAPLSVLAVFAISWHQAWASSVTVIAAVLVLVLWVAIGPFRLGRADSNGLKLASQTAALACAAVAVIFLSVYTYAGPQGQRVHLTVAWPWNVPIGFVVAFGLGWFLGRVLGEELPDGQQRRT